MSTALRRMRAHRFGGVLQVPAKQSPVSFVQEAVDTHVDIVEKFRAAWVFEAGWHGLELLPTALARAAAQVLAVDAAGISLMGGEHRVPIGASAPEATTAERWQFTIGDGPCFTAYERSEPVFADETMLRGQWPTLHDEIYRHSPFRAEVAMPLGHGASRLGVLDLYFVAPRIDPGFDLVSAQLVASLIRTSLLGASLVAGLRESTAGDETADLVPPIEPAPWLTNDLARRRQNVWVATGMFNVLGGVDNADALALLRAYAYTHEKTLEDVADDIVAGRTPVQALQEQIER
ncbi:MAG: GAF domain-containing protein [Janthinobacterium lividum]